MIPTRFIRSVAISAAMAALVAGLAATASAQSGSVYRGPAVYSGLNCSRCAPGATFCVVNPIRFEYTCAPQGTYACAGFQRTGFCRYGTTCWDGICR